MVSSVLSHFCVGPCSPFLLLFLPTIVVTVRVGMIPNTTYITPSIDQLFSNQTCSRCTCIALIANAAGWNCVTNNNTCQVFINYSSPNGYLERTNSGNFYFQQFPTQLLLTVTATTMTSTSTTSTTSTGK